MVTNIYKLNKKDTSLIFHRSLMFQLQDFLHDESYLSQSYMQEINTLSIKVN